MMCPKLVLYNTKRFSKKNLQAYKHLVIYRYWESRFGAKNLDLIRREIAQYEKSDFRTFRGAPRLDECLKLIGFSPFVLIDRWLKSC